MQNRAVARQPVPQMDFAVSTFAVEVNQTPTIVFQAKWAAAAEDLGFGWAKFHSNRISTKGSRGSDMPTVIKVRIARPAEKAGLDGGVGSELHEGTKIVYLVELTSFS